MATSTELELKSRLQKFLADPKADNDFRYWFASLLTQQNDIELEGLAQAIDSAFSAAAEGHCTPQQLRTYLEGLSSESDPADNPQTTQAISRSETKYSLAAGMKDRYGDVSEYIYIPVGATQTVRYSASGSYSPLFPSLTTAIDYENLLPTDAPFNPWEVVPAVQDL
jgi:hypothetical protein